MTNNDSVPAEVKSKADDTPIAPVIAENDIMKFFNLEKNDIQDFSITHAKDGISIHIRLNSKPHICPVCRQKSQRVNDNTKKKMNTAIVENRNKTIKLIKHSSNGFLNYERFRNRILFALNKDELININVTDGRLLYK